MKLPKYQHFAAFGDILMQSKQLVLYMSCAACCLINVILSS